MENLLIIGSYAKTKVQETQLKECINSLKPLGWDIMLVSHLPIDVEFQKEVTYFFYDKYNLLLPLWETSPQFVQTEYFEAKIYIQGHALAITKNMNTTFNLAKNLNYNFCYYMDCDFVFSLPDLEKIKLLHAEMINNGKKMILFNPLDHIIPSCKYETNGPYFINTSFFGAEPNFFIDVINPPKDYSDWKKNNMCYNLEVSFYERIKEYFDDVIRIDSFCENYFTNSEINGSRYGLFACEVINNLTDPDSPILFINNLEKNNKHVKLYINESLTNEINLSESWFFLPLKYDDSSIRVEVYDEFFHKEDKFFKMIISEKNNFELAGEISFR